MIGQESLINQLNLWKSHSKFPHFIILTGSKYSGRKTLAKEICNLLNAREIVMGLSVEDVRNCEKFSYTSGNNMCFIFPDADSMKPNTKSALLKITEEPPKNAYFIITLTNLNSFPDTLISRASTLSIVPYTKEHIKQLFNPGELQKEEIQSIIKYSPNIGIAHLLKNDTSGILHFCKKIIDNITLVSGANALKITSYFKTKQDSSGYDPEIILTLIKEICNILAKENKTDFETYRKYCKIALITQTYYKAMIYDYSNKTYCLDLWILQLRKNITGCFSK